LLGSGAFAAVFAPALDFAGVCVASADFVGFVGASLHAAAAMPTLSTKTFKLERFTSRLPAIA
jgi:hypothetical protein